MMADFFVALAGTRVLSFAFAATNKMSETQSTWHFTGKYLNWWQKGQKMLQNENAHNSWQVVITVCVWFQVIEELYPQMSDNTSD